MKNLLLLLCSFVTLNTSAQLFARKNINLLSYIDPNTSSVSSPVGNRYSGCWAWYQQSKNKEYAISGASHGTYFIDMTNPTTPSVSAFVAGKEGCTWREMKTYKNYCYIISDDERPNKFQIVDMQYLPDSVHVVHSGTQYFERGHTIWIDQDKMYIGNTTFSTNFSPMAIFSLATPTAPVLLKRLESDIANSVINEVHDMYVRNDTIYASAGWNGLYFLKHDVANDTLLTLGSYKGYVKAGYNHSSYMTQNGKYMMFCDEVPSSLPIHFIDIQNLSNVQPLVSFYPYPQTTAHNPYIIGNNFAVVSSYLDGLFIYDISQPTNVQLTGYFDTHPQGGYNANYYGGYSGNWGAYPWLPSGVIVANDMQNGVFFLDATRAYTTTVKEAINPVGVEQNAISEINFMMYPNPASTKIAIHYNSNIDGTLELKNILGQVVYQRDFKNGLNDYLDLINYESGTYLVSITTENKTVNKKLIIAR